MGAGIEFWDRKAVRDQTTGYSDPALKYFDQSVRLRTIDFLLDKYTTQTESTSFLDFGCGKGDFCAYFKDRFVTLYGYDPSTSVLELARNSNRHDNIHFIDELTKIDDQVDIAISITVLQHIINDDELSSNLLQIGSKCKKGAIFFVLESTVVDEINIPQPPHVKARRRAEWLKLFKEAGFVELGVFDFYNPGYFKNRLYRIYEKRIWLHQMAKIAFRKLGKNYPESVFKRIARSTLEDYPYDNGLLDGADSVSKIFVLKKK